MTIQNETLFSAPDFDLSAEEETNNIIKVEEEGVLPTKITRRGPPNRMNDLTYRDWMKFQKSFFRHTSYTDLVRECITFFTKSVWPDERRSRVLLLGFSIDESDLQLGERHIDSEAFASSNDLLLQLEKAREAEQKYDFVLVNLKELLSTVDDVTKFLQETADRYFELLRSVICPQSYCGMVVDLPGPGGKGFPIPWSVALAGRNHLRLRDEKIGLIEVEEKIYYCLFMQNIDDTRPLFHLTSTSIRTISEERRIDPWVMPKSPPRKKNEKLHPAKFPESLIEHFISNFTQPGDNVLDPMVGTGSAVLAAVKRGRNGFGVDLNQNFVDISSDRLANAQPPFLFGEFCSPARGTFIRGDAAHLTDILELQSVNFSYCITSPPYWSMLSNPGSENQQARRERNLPLVYSDNNHDLGNIADYDRFLDTLCLVYDQVALKLQTGGHLTVIVKNIKREHILYPLAWDLTARLCSSEGKYEYVGTTLWCQDDVGIKPFAVGIHWVSNILHHYCLHFRLRDDPSDDK
ncbi:MAG: hypothetical protein NVS2B12_05940 [Ktedonobacteraceae bacterium]